MSAAIVKQLKRIQRDFLADSSAGEPSPTLEAASRALIFSVLLAGYVEKQTTLQNGPLADLTQTRLSPERLKLALSYYDQVFGSQYFALADWQALEPKSDRIKSLVQKLLRLAASVNLSDLVGCFEGFARRSVAKKEGVFSTPLPIARAIVQDALASLRVNKHLPTFLDPACGSGIFLLELAQQCSQLFRYDDLASRSEFVQQSLFGVDKDHSAVQMTRLVLQLWLSINKQGKLFQFDLLPNLANNIKQGDSLLSSVEHCELELFGDGELFDWRRAFPSVFAQNAGFDCVIGNPPYGLARGEQLSEHANSLLKSLYREYRSGKINKYLAFMARGFELLSRDGVLSLLVPNSWLGIQGGKPIRQNWLKNGVLKRINLYDCAVFDDPSVEAVSFVAIKEGGCREVELVSYGDLEHRETRSRVNLSAEECLKTPDAVIPLNWSAPASELYQHIRNVSFDLAGPESGFVPLIALQAYAQGKGTPPQDEQAAKHRIFHTNYKGDENTYPYLDGSDVGRFKLTWSGHYLKYGPWLAEVQSLQRFSGTRILLREIIRPKPYLLAACLVNEIYLYNKSVLHILPSSKSAHEAIWTLLGVLNSKLASFVIGFAGRKSQRKIFPKIVNADLLSFPIAKLFQSAGAEVALLARKLSECEPQQDRELYARMNHDLDRAVYALYALRNSQVELIEREYPSAHPLALTGKE